MMFNDCSILIPVYNGKLYIEKAIYSALDQGDEVKEIIIIDNCSNDGTFEYLKSLNHSKIKIFQNKENIGLFGNFNECLKHVTSSIFVILCADDQMFPNAVSCALKFFNKHSSTALLNTSGIAEDVDGNFLKNLSDYIAPGLYDGKKAVSDILDFFSRTGIHTFNYPCGIFFNNHILKNNIFFNTEFKGSGDIEFYLRVLELGDLGISHVKTSRVLYHKNQIGQLQHTTPLDLEEWLTIYDEFSPDTIFQKKFRNAIYALVLIKSIKFLAKGNIIASKSHFEFSMRRKETFRIVLYLIRALFFKLLAKFKKPTLLLQPKK